jgi:hypothetical protein
MAKKDIVVSANLSNNGSGHTISYPLLSPDNLAIFSVCCVSLPPQPLHDRHQDQKGLVGKSAFMASQAILQVEAGTWDIFWEFCATGPGEIQLRDDDGEIVESFPLPEPLDEEPSHYIIKPPPVRYEARRATVLTVWAEPTIQLTGWTMEVHQTMDLILPD